MNKLLSRIAVASALLAGVASAQADLTFFTSQSDYLSYLANPATDGFSDLSGQVGQAVTPAPQRQVGSFGFGIYAYNFFPGNEGSDPVEVTGTAANPTMSTQYNWSYLILDNFSGGANAIGFNVWGATDAGAFMPGQTIEMDVLDSKGEQFFYFTPTSTDSFIGMISTGTIKIVDIRVMPDGTIPDQAFTTIDNIMMGQAAAVPEPSVYALMLGGLGLVGFVARRRRAA